MPVATLDWPADIAHALGRWGVATLGELASLPRAGLAARLGAAGLAAHDLARGMDDPAPWTSWTPPPFWEEAQELDWEIDALGPLVAVLERVLERLTARLSAAHLLADTLELRLALTGGGHHARTLALASPMDAPRPLLMIHGGADSYIKPDMARALFDLARAPKELWLVEKAKHNQSIQVAGEEYKQRVLAFFDRYLASLADLSAHRLTNTSSPVVHAPGSP